MVVWCGNQDKEEGGFKTKYGIIRMAGETVKGNMRYGGETRGDIKYG
jgi:hypothetical protein